MKTSLLISTYNWPEALELVLMSVENQSENPDEILIADDGSKEETKECIENFQKKLTIPIRHFWHEDKGFRKAIILNKTIAVATGDYLIQVDGDCILHKDFIRDHKALAQPMVYLFGSRVNIREEFLPKLFASQKMKFGFFNKNIEKRTRNLRVPAFSNLFKTSNKFSEKMRGCNVSFWRKDVLAVNGYNEEFEGWGREDSELVIRMMNNGILGRRLRYRGIVYHIWHQVKDLSRFEINDTLQEKSLVEKSTWCERGIDQYL